MSIFSKFCLFLSSLGLINGTPFKYDLHITSLPGTNSRILICMHGSGHNFTIAKTIKEQELTQSTLVSFNFPDHDLQEKTDFHKATFGTIDEILPAAYVLKKYVIDQGLKSIDLYGFSAGGGALINLIAALNSTTYDKNLKAIGIGSKEKQQLLQAIQKGIVLLDAPLKSTEEIIDLRGSSDFLETVSKQYRDHHSRPIDSLELLKGLSLNAILYFEKEDEILFNRDDELYIQRLKKANSKGSTTVIIGEEGGHLAPHPLLWQAYEKELSTK